MSKAKAGPETPTEVLAKAAETQSETDARGRVITVRQMNALQQYRFFKALGASTSANPTASELAMLACMVVKIDAQDVAMPATEREVEFLIQQLDHDGLIAAAGALKKFNADIDAERDTAKN
jgi:hypothetical protein